MGAVFCLVLDEKGVDLLHLDIPGSNTEGPAPMELAFDILSGLVQSTNSDGTERIFCFVNFSRPSQLSALASSNSILVFDWCDLHEYEDKLFHVVTVLPALVFLEWRVDRTSEENMRTQLRGLCGRVHRVSDLRPT